MKKARLIFIFTLIMIPMLIQVLIEPRSSSGIDNGVDTSNGTNSINEIDDSRELSSASHR